MTPAAFRTIALSMPEAVEGEHMGHPDFRVAGKIFATLLPDAKRGMVKLTPEQQGSLIAEHPGVFEPAAGMWGKRGATLVVLRAVGKTVLRSAMIAAWRNTAPRRLVARF